MSDITLNDVAALQRKRLAEGLSARSVNCEVATLRQILKHCGCWMPLAGRVRFLRERTDSGRALALEEDQLLDAISRSPSPVLYPFFVLSLDAGLRPSESRALRRSDLTLHREDGAIVEGEMIVWRQDEGGTGRVVPLTNRACGTLTIWYSRFPDAGPDSYVFPFHRVGLAGNSRKPLIWDVDLNCSMGQWSYKSAFETARRTSGIACRFYKKLAPHLCNPACRKSNSVGRDHPPTGGTRQRPYACSLRPHPGYRRGGRRLRRWSGGAKLPALLRMEGGGHKIGHNPRLAGQTRRAASLISI